MTGRDPVRVRRWTYPKERGGTGGFIPTEPAQLLLTEAVRKGIPLRAEHFFMGVDGHPISHGPDITPVQDRAPATAPKSRKRRAS